MKKDYKLELKYAGFASILFAIVLALHQNNLLTYLWLYISIGTILTGTWLMYWMDIGKSGVRNEKKQ